MKRKNLCNRVAIMNNGKIAAMDTPQNLINIHANLIRLFSAPGGLISIVKNVPHVHNSPVMVSKLRLMVMAPYCPSRG